MSSVIIDRRLNPKGKSLGNRQRFLKKINSAVKNAIKDAIRSNNIEGVASGNKVKIPAGDISQPNIIIDGKTGNKNIVLAGNTIFTEGDKIEKPKSGGGKGPGQDGAPDGSGEDEFIFVLNKDEFLDYFFEDLELPNLEKKDIVKVLSTSYKHAGYTNEGNPANLDVRRSYTASLARRVALSRPKKEEIEKLEKELEQILSNNPVDDEKVKILSFEIEKLKKRRKRIPYFDDMDLRYKFFKKQPEPATNAVMFCILDVSGSMDETKKEWAKKFFILLYLFLQRFYSKVDIVFIRHHSEAEEVDEETFFKGKDTGGTVVSTALDLMKNIIKERYNKSHWNIYAGQVSDGDNYSSDNDKVSVLLDELLPKMQYYAYVQISTQMSEMNRFFAMQALSNNLWSTFSVKSKEHKNLNTKHITNNTEIWPVFRELFKKKGANA